MISGCLKLWDMNFLNSQQRMKNNELSILCGGFCFFWVHLLFISSFIIWVWAEKRIQQRFLFPSCNVKLYTSKKKLVIKAPKTLKHRCLCSHLQELLTHVRLIITNQLEKHHNKTRLLISLNINRWYFMLTWTRFPHHVLLWRNLVFPFWLCLCKVVCAVMRGGSMSPCHSLVVHLKQPESYCQLHMSNWIVWASLNNWL